ncbi:rhodanese-like domain-containing protein [sulfur-oxidizing endosymbiont of Gigantopelta aegis]|uniref:rhodanese-like domain-containing protein n=1 Tax=sulfur-oxidizing endosymbiont of Gigantopelta aegis TaxID=2794934 RepID=UPI0018DE906A|nr:rhodanese-like domain-containing protein [sulfur-oxidizing endosymbiont of Gigantopelta aegis]
MICRAKLINSFLTVCFISLFFLSDVAAEVVNLGNKQLKQMLADNVPIIDLRRYDEWQSTGIVENSHLITFFDSKGNYNVETWLQALDKIVAKNDKFILICRTGNRTGTVAHFLDKKLGYTQVYHVQRGIKNWIQKGNKVISVK